MDGETLQKKTTHKGKKNIQLSISRGRREVESMFGISVSGVRVLLGSIEQRPKIVKDIVFTCVVLHNMLTLRNDQVVYVRDDNYRNPSREAIQQQDTLKECFNHYGYWRGRMTGPEMCQPTTLGPEEADIYQSFSGLPSYSKNFYLIWCCLNFQRKYNSFSASFKTVLNQITSPLLKNFNPSYVKMVHIKSQKL